MLFPTPEQPSQPSEPLPLSQIGQTRKENLLRVSIHGDKAYWVKDNVFYQGDFIDGHVVHGSAQPIDAYALPEEEMHKLLKVLDGLG
jgi:hypothetical protein